jgi:GT2 family glycosyltransferase/glycosyltransferase involved in cell wall biosynthesis
MTVRKPRALICSYHLPQPDLDSSSRRLHHFVRFLLDEGWDVTAAARNPERGSRPARALGQLGVPVYTPIGPDLHRLIEEEPFDVAVLAFWHVAELLLNFIRRSSPGTRVVVDSMDLHFLRHARRIFSPGLRDPAGGGLDDAYAADLVRELNVYAAADAVLAVSEKEAALVSDFTGDPALGHAVPDCEELAPSPFAFGERRGLLFIGNFEHSPNVDAVDFLCGEILPRLGEEFLRDHPLTIVGNDAEVLLRNPRVDDPHVRLVGWVPSVVPYLERARVSLIPLLYGAGTKRKLIQSLMVGTPAVSTTVGIEGLDLADAEHVLIADDATSFAEAIARLAGDRALWEQLSDAGRRHVVARRGPEAARRGLAEALAQCLGGPPKRALVPVPEWTGQGTALEPTLYRGLVRRIRRVVRQTVPPDAVVAVVSRGDPELADLDGREAWHFPNDDETGGYAGFHPSDSDAAIAGLEALRQRGVAFFVLPSTAFWWLETYQEFARYLEERFRTVVQDSTCMVVDLRAGKAAADGTVPVNAVPRRKASQREPLISVVIPTRNRADLLEASLESLAAQSLARESFEVVVVDDGSTDSTPLVCDAAASRLGLRYQALDHVGIGAAKNAGVRAASGSIVVFFDDDDVAHADLLLEHAKAHEERPEEEVAVLGHTRWAPSLAVTEVMRFVTDVGHYLFSYDGLAEGQELDFTYFWGGRTSCKRPFLARHGLFSPQFTFGSEDIELGYRLSRFGLRVVYRPQALQYMNRPITFDEFCARCERQGGSQWLFSRMHLEPEIQEWCGVVDAEERWERLEGSFEEKRARVEELERLVASLGGTKEQARVRQELWDLYWWSFEACKLKGIVDGRRRAEFTPLLGQPDAVPLS